MAKKLFFAVALLLCVACVLAGCSREGVDVHTHEGKLQEAKAATCTADGNAAYYSCSCGKLFSDEGCTTEITSDEVKIPAKGHTPDYPEATTEHGILCTVCGVEIAKKLDPAHQHTPGEWIGDAENHWRVCSGCAETIDLAAHTPDYPEATTEHGILCTVCGYEIAKKIEPLYTTELSLTYQEQEYSFVMNLYADHTVTLMQGTLLSASGTWSVEEGIIAASVGTQVYRYTLDTDEKTLLPYQEQSGEATYSGIVSIDDMNAGVACYEGGAAILSYQQQELDATWTESEGIVTVTTDTLTFRFTIDTDGKTLHTYDPELGKTLLYTAEYAPADAVFRFYADGCLSLDFGGTHNEGVWKTTQDGLIAGDAYGTVFAFIASPDSTEITYVDNMFDPAYYAYRYLVIDSAGKETGVYPLVFSENDGMLAATAAVSITEENSLVVRQVAVVGTDKYVNDSVPKTYVPEEYYFSMYILDSTEYGFWYQESQCLQSDYIDTTFGTFSLKKDGTVVSSNVNNGKWSEAEGIVTIDSSDYGKLYFVKKDDRTARQKLEPAIPGEDVKILYTYEGGESTVRLFENGKASFSLSGKTRFVSDYTIVGSQVNVSSTLGWMFFKNESASLTDTGWREGGEHEVVKVSAIEEAVHFHAVGTTTFEKERFTVRYTDLSAREIHGSDLTVVEGSVDFNTPGEYTLRVSYEGFECEVSFDVGLAGDYYNCWLSSGQYRVWMIRGDEVIPEFGNMRVVYERYGGDQRKVPATAEDFNADDIAAALAGSLGETFTIRHKDSTEKFPLQFEVVLLTEDAFYNQAQVFNCPQYLYYSIRDGVFLPEASSVIILEKTVEYFRDETWWHVPYMHEEPLSDWLDIPDEGDTIYTKAGTYFYSLKAHGDLAPENTVIVIAVEAPTSGGYFYDYGAAFLYENPFITLPTMQLAENPAVYLQRVLDYLNGNENYQFIAQWDIDNYVIYEAIITDFTAEMFDLSPINPAVQGLQIGYLTVKDYLGRDVKIEISITVE